MGTPPPPLPMPLPAYSFRVSVGDETVRFTEIMGLEVAREFVVYKHGLSFGGEMLITAPSRSHVTVTMKRGVMRGDGLFYSWLISSRSAARPIDVVLVDAAGAPAATWRVARAVPVKFSGPSFNAAANEVAIETLELKAFGISYDAGTA